MTSDEIQALVGGADTTLAYEAQKELQSKLADLSSFLRKSAENAPNPYTNGNIASRDAISQNGRKKLNGGDASMFTSISDMINGNTKDFAGFGTLLDNLYAKNKKYFTIIKDYEIMPILIPQINRVLDFLVNECLSPDIQNDKTFMIRYIGQQDGNTALARTVQKDVDSIRHEMKLDSLLREVYMNRYKLGREYYAVQNYTATFEHMIEKLKEKRLGESAAVPDGEYVSTAYSFLSETINDVSGMAVISAIDESKDNYDQAENPRAGQRGDLAISDKAADLSFSGLNIVIERSSITDLMESAYADIIAESYSRFSARAIISGSGKPDQIPLNEDTGLLDVTKLEQLATTLKKKKLKRCTVTRFDPAKMFKLKIGGKVIGYFYVTDINEGVANVVNFAQSLKDQLLKSRASNLSAATQTAEEVISKELAKKIINTFDPNIGISRIEDIDLLHDFIRNNEIYKGNKRITFYYEDEVFDLSRSNDSILINAVFFTKLYATLLLNNIVTKVLRGRGRQIHTVRLGVSPNVRRYVDNAMAALAMPEHNLGTLHGSFEQIMNPFNGASDIVIPTEEDEQRYITTDYIPGQDVDMNDEFLRTLLNSIVTSFGLDSAVIDATNGNLQFARTLTMESLQIANSIKNEQQDLHDPWERLVLEVLRIMGNDDTKAAVDNGQIEVSFFEPKSLITMNTIEEINNVKTMAEGIADIMPRLNSDDATDLRACFIYKVVKECTNLDLGKFEDFLSDSDINAVYNRILASIDKLKTEAVENTTEQPIQQMMAEDDDDDMSSLSAEERDILGTNV